jgi:hypothetical protein
MSHQQQQGYSPSFYSPAPASPYSQSAYQHSPSPLTPQGVPAIRQSYFAPHPAVTPPLHPLYPSSSPALLAPLVEGHASNRSSVVGRSRSLYDPPPIPSAPPAQSFPTRLARTGSLSTMPVGLIQPIRSSKSQQTGQSGRGSQSTGPSSREEEPLGALWFTLARIVSSCKFSRSH